ncbi:phage major tail protein, TP901-1 family [bacterium]|nr:phage major tail protein, TP901-1 family [bacterium]
MAATRGRLMLIKVGSAASGTLLGGLKTTGFKMNTQPVDISTKDTNGWRELLEDGSLKSVTISGNGIFKDSATDEAIRAAVFSGSISTFTLVFPNGDTIEGQFLVTNYERTGGHEGPEEYTLALESSGEPTFTAA